MTDDLVKRLRDLNDKYGIMYDGTANEVADRIEALELEQRRIISENIELKELIQSVCDYTGTVASTTWIRFDPQPKWHLKDKKDE